MATCRVKLLPEVTQFVKRLPLKVQKKITYNLLKVEGGELNSDLFKKLEGSQIWEFRTIYGSNCYRLFAFWDTTNETLVIATHGLLKKTQKTPRKEIDKAESIRKQYFDNK